jgi:NADH dehydrogenase
MRHVLIVGGGFVGLNAAKVLGNAREVEVTLLDRENFHLFQPLLYQVAMAGLSPAEIAVPIRSILSQYGNIQVLKERVISIDLKTKKAFTDVGELGFDYLIMACGAQHTYYGHEEWEEYAPGLKTIEQATEIRRRILSAFERAESQRNTEKMKKLLTFVIIGGGTTGVELAGAIGEMSRYFFLKDFKHINPQLIRVILIEAGPRILPSFSERLANRATQDLKGLGVQVWTSKRVTKVDSEGVEIGKERIQAATVLWAAGIQASQLNRQLGGELDPLGRVKVGSDLSLKEHPEVFVAGDQAHVSSQNGKPLPGLAPVAVQEGRFIAKNILNEINGLPRQEFHYKDKGQMATIGRSRAILELGRIRLCGPVAWVMWLFIHIYSLTGFKNRLFVILQWAISYLTFRKGARLIVGKEWRFYGS